MNNMNISRPTDASIILTYRCPMRCQMCNIWKNPTNRQEEIKAEDLKSLPQLKFINLTGGEPFIREDLEEIVEECYRHTPRIVISTSGWFEDRVIALAKKFPNIGIRISIEVSTPGTLSDEILRLGHQPSEINYLTVSGTLDNNDLKIIRDFMPKLVSIDLTRTTLARIPDYTFSQKKYLTEVLFPPTLQSIGERAFSGCIRLGQDLILPPELNSIGEGAFLDCHRLQRVLVTGNKLSVIGKDLFRNDQNKLIYRPE